MTNWDINEADARGVVQRAASAASSEDAGYPKKFTTLQDSITALSGALTHSQLVSGSLADFTTKVIVPDSKAVAGHTSSAILGTSDAIAHYHNGHYDMAATAQSNAAKADYPTTMPGKGQAQTGMRHGQEPK